MNVVDVEGRRFAELPADAGSRVDGIPLDEIIRDHRADLTGATRRDEAFERSAAEDSADVRIVTQPLHVGDADHTARELIDRSQLIPRTIPCDVDAGSAADDQPAVAPRVPRRADARLDVVGVGAAVARDEIADRGHGGIGEHARHEVVDPEIQVHVVADAGVDVHALG